MSKLSILIFTLIFGCIKSEFETRDKVFSLAEFKTLVLKEDIEEYFLKNEYDFKQKLEEKKETILHILLEKKMQAEAIMLLDKLKELTEEERDEFLKHKDEKGNEALYLAIDRENIEIVDKMLELYSEKARNKRLCFEYDFVYCKDTILDRAMKNRSAKGMISLIELKKKYRPEDLENSKNYKVRTEVVITDILEEIKRIVEEQDKEESFESEEILLNEEEQKESIILKLIEENMEKRQDKQEIIKKENKFKRLIQEKREEILILASYVGDKGVIERYIEEVEVNTKDKEGTTLLFLASDSGHKEIVEQLLSKGASVDLGEKSIDATPLYQASAHGHKEVVELLLSKGASIDLANRDGTTPLCIASWAGKKEVVELLLSKGASTDLADKDGATPLLIASQNGHKEVVKLLLTNEAAIDLAEKSISATPLYIASAEGHKAVVEFLLTKGADVDLANRDGTTPLCIASWAGKKEVVELLLSKGASTDLADKDGSTPLYTASTNGHKEVVELLLTKGASIDLAMNEGSTPLYISSQNGHREIVELLLTKGASIDLADKDGTTPLYIASENGHKEVVELLLTKEASIDLANKDGSTPLFIASQSGRKEVVELLLTKEAPIDLACKDGATPLFIASQSGRKEVVELLLTKEAKIDLAMNDGKTPLYIASQNGHKEVVKVLIENGASVDLGINDGRTPLYTASTNGHKEVVELLLTMGASIDLARNDGETPLCTASFYGHKEVVELLLTKGASIDLADKDGRTPLYIASGYGYKEVVELLLTKGASIDLADKDGATPLYIASGYGYKEVVELLLTKGASIDLADKDGRTPLYTASSRGHKEVVELLLTNEAAIDLARNDGETPLCTASFYGHKEVVELLLTKGASIDLAMNDGRTPLYIASGYGYKEVVELLLTKEASIDLACKDGATPLYIASQNGHKEVVELLLKKGSSVDLAMNDERTPLYTASTNGHKEVVELLLTMGASIDLAEKSIAATQLYTASEKGHKEIVELLLTIGAKIDLAMNDGKMPLYIASQNGHKEVVEVLIKNGASIDLADKDGYTSLYIASTNGHKEVVELLIEKGAAINLSSNDGITPLYIASHNGHREVVELLLTKGASIDLVQQDGATPLHIASQNGDKEVVELLLTKGASIDLAMNDGRTPLFIASYNGRKGVVELLLTKGAKIDLAQKYGATPLFIASDNGHKEVVEVLLTNGASVDLGMNDGRTPLYIASQQGHKEVVELLLARGATIDLGSNDGMTPLYIASQQWHKEVVELLLRKGAKIKDFKSDFPHKKADFVNNIISYTLEINNTSSLFSGKFLLKEKNIDLYIKLSNFLPFSFMLENFFDIPLRNYYQYNSLHLAVMQDSTDSLKKLLSNRDIFCFVNSTDNKEKESCLALAHRLNKIDHIKVLLSFAISPIYVKDALIRRNFNTLDIPNIREYIANEVLFQAIKESRIENAAELLNVLSYKNNNYSYKRIINLKALDNEGNNAFHALAIYTDSIKMISNDNKMNVEHFLNRCLAKLENGTYEIPSFSEELIFAYNNLGQTPFHCAILYSNEDFVEYFLTSEKIKREDVTKLTKDGKSIFELIENNSVSKEVVTLLIKHLWSDKDIASFYKSAKVSEEDKEIYKAIKEDRGDLIKDLKIKEEDIMRMINLSIKLNAFNCLKELMCFATKEEMKSLLSTEFIFKMCEENKAEILDILLKLDEEKLVEKGEEGNTLLHKACLMKREEIVMHLVGYREVFEFHGPKLQEIKGYNLVKENMSVQNEQGNTAMHNAHIALSPSLIYILSKAGANPHIKNKIGKRAIDLLADIPRISQEEKIRIGTINSALCALLNREYDGEYRLTLHLAILAKVDWVINDHSSIGLINEVDEEGNTALHLAVREEREEVVKKLLNKGADFFLRNKLGETPLELIKSKGILMLLINAALEKNMISEYILNIQNIIGNTLLHLTIDRTKIKRIEVESRNKSKETKKEIKEEIELIDKHLIEAILDNGGSKDKVNREGKTPIDLARKSKMLEEFLIGYEPKLLIMQNRETKYFKEKSEKDRKKEINEQEEKEVIEVLNEKRNQYQKLCTGRMPIHVVVERNDDFALEMLLSKGFNLKCLFDAEWLDKEGKNCYEIAVNKLNADVFKILIDKAGVSDIFKETSSHSSPIYLAITIEKGDKLFKAVFEKLKKEYQEGKFEIHKLKNDKQQEYKIREMKKDPISEILKKDSEEMLEKMMEIGLKIVDEDGNNLVTEAINKGARKIFKNLVNKVDNPEVFLRQYKQKKVAIEQAQFQYSTLQDNFYLKAIRERLEKMKDGRGYFHILYEKVDAQEAIQVFEVLNGKRRHDEKLTSERKAIHFFVEHKDVLGLNAVLAMGSNPEWEDNIGNNCYEIAINSADMSSSLECFKILLDHLSTKKNLIFETEKHPSILWLVLEKRERITRDKLLDIILKKMKKEYEDKKFTFEDMRKLKRDPIRKIIERDDKEALEKLIGIGLKLEEIQSNLLEEARIRESAKIIQYLISA